MTRDKISDLLRKQPKSYLQYKDRNKFDETDLYNLQNGILKRKDFKEQQNKDQSKKAKVIILVTHDGITERFKNRRLIAEKFNIS